MSVYAADAPRIVRDFLTYISTIRGKSAKTAHEYYLDLRLFFRIVKHNKRLVPAHMALDQIPFDDVDMDFIREITLSDVYDYLEYLASERETQQNSASTGHGLSGTSRARKISTLRTFFKYLTDKVHLLDVNPVSELESTTIRRSLPTYLSIEESVRLLDAVQGEYAERDYCILTLFLNCGLRVSELAGLNVGDIQNDRMRVLGKGNKERIVYLNDACVSAIENYLPHRVQPHEVDKRALFVSRNRNRINVQTVKWLVKKYLGQAGLDTQKYSTHKLRHTAATLMYQNGVDIRTLQDVLGHTSVNTTMIYTHIKDESLREAADKNPLSGVKRQEKREEDNAAKEETD